MNIIDELNNNCENKDRDDFCGWDENDLQDPKTYCYWGLGQYQGKDLCTSCKTILQIYKCTQDIPTINTLNIRLNHIEDSVNELKITINNLLRQLNNDNVINVINDEFTIMNNECEYAATRPYLWNLENKRTNYCDEQDGEYIICNNCRDFWRGIR